MDQSRQYSALEIFAGWYIYCLKKPANTPDHNQQSDLNKIRIPENIYTSNHMHVLFSLYN